MEARSGGTVEFAMSMTSSLIKSRSVVCYINS
jgi:hypothetical protein